MKLSANLRILPIIILLSLSSFFVGVQIGTMRVPSPKEVLSSAVPSVLVNTDNEKAKEVDFGKFWEVWNLIHADHIDRENFNDQELVYGAIRGMVQAIGDPYTAFLPPEKNDQFRESLSGTYEGIGAELGMREDQLIIVAPLDGSPAESVGVQPQDKIVKIEDENTIGITIPEAVGKIRGPAGEVVRLTLFRDSVEAPFEVSITRAEITLKSVKFDNTKLEAVENYQQFGDGIAYLRMSRFGDNTTSEWNTSVTSILQDVVPLKALILDLRSNPGGYLRVSIELAGDLLSSGTPVVKQVDKDGRTNTFSAKGPGRLVDVPIVLLVNEGSASASEILASALKENREVTIVGKKTFGKGTVQEKRDLSDGSGVQITVAKWLTPSGIWVNGEGVPVDIEVEITPDDITAKRDPQLEKALEIAAGLTGV